MEIEDAIRWFEQQGVKVKRKWGCIIGRYYEGNYKGFRFICCRVTDEGYLAGHLLKFYFSRRSQLGLHCTANICVLSPPSPFYRGKDLLAKKFDPGIRGLNCHAVKKDIAERLFRQEEIRKTINTLKSILNIPQKNGILKQLLFPASSLWIDDREIGVFVSERSGPGVPQDAVKDVVNAMVEFCTAVDNFAIYYGSEVFKPDKVQNAIHIALIIFLIVEVGVLILYIISSFGLIDYKLFSPKEVEPI